LRALSTNRSHTCSQRIHAALPGATSPN